MTQKNSIFDFLNRPRMKHEADEKQAAQKAEAKRKQGSWFVRNAKWLLLVFSNVVAITFDALAVWSVYVITGNYLFSFLALLPTGVPMVLWEIAWMYPLASPTQKKRAIRGIIASIVSALIVGFSSVAVEIGAVYNIPVVQTVGFGVLLVSAVIAVVYHAVNAGKYFYEDPITEQEHNLQVAISEQDFQAQALTHTDSILSLVSVAAEREKRMREQYGDAVIDRALGIVLGVQIDSPKQEPQKPPVQPMPSVNTQPAYKSNGNHPEPAREPANPTQGRER